MQKQFNTAASIAFWAFLAFLIISAIFMPDIWNEAFPGEWIENTNDRLR